MRPLKANETMKRRRGGTIEYFDELGRNVFYYNPHKGVWYDKSWVRLPNGEDRETYVESNNGYWRRHWYDIHTGRLLKEIDSNGETNLIDKRRNWNPKEEELSEEYRTQGVTLIGNAHKLF